MGFRGDARGVTVQVGAVLLLGIVVISLSLFQTTVVPNENKQVEFQHNQLVQDDMQSFRSAVTRAGGAGLTQSVAVRLGTQYPERALFINPPPPTGTLRTADSGDIEITNARALDDEEADYWTGSDTRTFTTKQVSYSPTYHVYQNAPTTVYESGVLYNRFDGGETVPQSGQSIVDGRTINLVAVDGELSRSQLGAVAVDVRPKSVSQRTLTVEGDGGQVTVLVPTELSVSTWQDLLADEIDSGGVGNDADEDRYIESVNSGPGDTVELIFEPDYQYNLNLAKVGVGTGGDDTTATYLTAVDGDGATVAEGSDQQLVVEVRDEFNNPISGQPVSASVTSGPGSVDSSPAVSGSDGRAVFTYSAPPNVNGAQSVTVEAEFGANPEEHVEFQLSAADSDGSGGSGGGGGGGDAINPNSADAVILSQSTINATTCTDGDSRVGQNRCLVDVVLENLDPNNAQKIQQARFNFYDLDATNNNPPNAPRSVEIVRSGSPPNIVLKAANSGGEYKRITPSIEIDAGDTETIQFKFYSDENTTTPFDVEQGDFFVVSVVFDNGRSGTYFVAPEEG